MREPTGPRPPVRTGRGSEWQELLRALRWDVFDAINCFRQRLGR